MSLGELTENKNITARIYMDDLAEERDYHDTSNINLVYFKGMPFDDINRNEVIEYIILEQHDSAENIKMSRSQFEHLLKGLQEFKKEIGVGK